MRNDVGIERIESEGFTELGQSNVGQKDRVSGSHWTDRCVCCMSFLVLGRRHAWWKCLLVDVLLVEEHVE